jgi:hypothetical protein
MYDITPEEKSDRFNILHNKMVDTFTNYNDLSYSIFRVVSKFSELLPDSLGTLVKLSDMITDALVVSGRSSLSNSIFNTKIVSNTLNLNPESSSLTLAYKTATNYTINARKSYIQTENNYSIYNPERTTLSSFSDLIKGSPILLETDDQYFKYTLSLSLDTKGPISCIDLELSLNTSSYPLISEIYYINDNNKKVYCTIMNSSEKQYNLDIDRQKNNVYTILLPNIKTSKIYITLEDKNKTDIIINKIGVRKLSYEAEGEIIIGPIVSSYPILKASVEALGDVDNANFYISPDNQTWYELAAPTELSFTENLDKIIAFNTVSPNSLKSNEDYKQIYLRVKLRRILESDSENFYTTTRQELLASTTLIDNDPSDITVYEIKEPIHYGATTFKDSVTSDNLFIDTLAYTESKGEYFVRGFVESSNSITPTTDKRSLNITTKPLKVGADNLEAISFEPVSANVYGFAITTKTGKINTRVAEDVVFLLNTEYSKDVYTITQNNKQIKIDLSLGYISSGLEAILVVAESGDVLLLDSTSKLIKKLTIRSHEDLFYIDLLQEGLFNIPVVEEGVTFNSLYPIKLNTETEYGLKDNKIVCKDFLLTFHDLGRLFSETIEFETKLSKENGNRLVILDNVLKERYTEYSEEVIPAYSGMTVIKLKNKHIKKGSLTLSIKND